MNEYLSLIHQSILMYHDEWMLKIKREKWWSSDWTRMVYEFHQKTNSLGEIEFDSLME